MLCKNKLRNQIFYKIIFQMFYKREKIAQYCLSIFLNETILVEIPTGWFPYINAALALLVNSATAASNP